MRIGMIGLGKMGANMTERLLKGGHEVVAFDLSADAVKAAAAKGAEAATSLADLADKLGSAQGGVGHAAGRATSPIRPSRSWPACSPRATSSSTAATPTTRNGRRWRPSSSTPVSASSTPGRRAACGA